MVAHVLHPNAGLLHHFPGYRFLNRLSLVHKAGQRRVGAHPLQASPRLAQQAPVAGRVGHHGDNHRVGARKMLRAAGGAQAHLPAPSLDGGIPADGAEAVPQVPVQLGAGLGQHPGVGAGHAFAGSAAVLKMPARAIHRPLGGSGVFGQVNGEVSRAVQQAQEYPLGVVGQRVNCVGGQPAQFGRRVVGEQHVQVAEGQKLAGRIYGLLSNPVLIAAFYLATVEGVVGKDVGFSHRLVHLGGWMENVRFSSPAGPQSNCRPLVL